MLKNFSLGAIISIDSKGGKDIIVLDPEDELCKDIQSDWSKQYHEFTKGRIKKIYNSNSRGVKLNHQYFVMESYELPEFMSIIRNSNNEENIINTENIDRIRRDHGVERKNILCFFAVAKDDETEAEIILFQNFTAGKIIEPWRCLSERLLHPLREFTRQNLYTENTRNDMYLVLDSKLTAIYNSKTKELLFNNYSHTNKTLPIPDYRSKEISDKEIEGLLSHPIFICKYIDFIAKSSNAEIRLCFANLRDDNILDEIVLDLLIDNAIENNVKLVVKGNQIVVPKDDDKIIELLMLINGDLTERKFTVNPQSYKITAKEKR